MGRTSKKDQTLERRTRRKTATVSGESQDRTRYLPVDILYIILFFLPIKAAARTCVLSKKWATVWISSPYLYFNSEDPEFATMRLHTGVTTRSRKRPLHTASFAECVDTVLNRRPSVAGLVNFSLVWHHGFDMMKACAWVERVVTQHNPRAVHVTISPQLGDTLAFSDTLFSSETLNSLRVTTGNGCAYWLQTPGIVSLPKIKSIILSGFVAPISFLGDLISGCPLLEVLLIMVICPPSSAAADVVVTAPNLRKWSLWIDGSSVPVCSKIRITAPKLEDLVCFFGGVHLEDFAINSRELLEILHVRTCFDVVTGVHLARIINGLPAAKTLCLSDQIIQSFAMLPDLSKHISSSFSRLQCLEIETTLHGISIPVILGLLKSFKVLVKLVINNLKEQDDLVLEWVPQDLSFDFYLHHLKEIEIRDFVGNRDELDLLNILLNKATTLQVVRMIAAPVLLSSETWRTKIEHNMLTMTRASPSILFRVLPLFDPIREYCYTSLNEVNLGQP